MNYDNILQNRTFVYVYPMIADIINYETNLIGCYIGDEDKPQYFNHILLRYKYSGDTKDSYLKFEKEIQECTLFEDYYDIKDEHNDTIMVVFKVPEEYQEDYDYFRKSLYSKMSKKYKDRIINFHGVENASLLKGILYKTKEAFAKLKKKLYDDNDRHASELTSESELTDAWYPEDEIFSVEVLSR